MTKCPCELVPAYKISLRLELYLLKLTKISHVQSIKFLRFGCRFSCKHIANIMPSLSRSPILSIGSQLLLCNNFFMVLQSPVLLINHNKPFLDNGLIISMSIQFINPESLRIQSIFQQKFSLLLENPIVSMFCCNGH